MQLFSAITSPVLSCTVLYRYVTSAALCCAVLLCGACGTAGVGGWAESGVNPAEYSRMLMRVACAYIEGADVRAVSSVDSWQSTPCASLNSYDSLSFSSLDSGSSSDGSGSGRDPTAAVAVVDPRQALATAHKFTKLPGSATACVLQLCPEKKSLIAANLVSVKSPLLTSEGSTCSDVELCSCVAYLCALCACCTASHSKQPGTCEARLSLTSARRVQAMLIYSC
jgi:hypothetical protein